MAGRLDGKVAIITGAGQGIGLAYAQRYLDEGANVVIAEINDERAASGLEALRQAGYKDDRVISVHTDISSEESAEACAAKTNEAFGTIDILLNNAALYHDIDNFDPSMDYLKKVYDVNLHGGLIMARAAVPTMVDKGAGRVINQSSSAAFLYQMPVDLPFMGVGTFAYSQTKWGVVGLTKLLAGQLGLYGVTVNCICPGLTMTEATNKQVPGEFQQIYTNKSALRKELQPEDLTGAAVFFASDDGAFCTGQILCVDGGLTM